MKIYKADQLTVTNSAARNPNEVEVPPFFFKGRMRAGGTGKWYAPRDITIVAGYVTAKEPGTTLSGLALLKHNIFEQNIVVATVLLPASGVKALFALENPLGGTLDATPYDYFTVASFSSSGHVDVTCDFVAIEKQ